MASAISPSLTDPPDSPMGSPSGPGRLGLLLGSYYADSSSADSSGEVLGRSDSVDSALPANEGDYDSQSVSELTRAYVKLSQGSAELESDLRMLLYENCTKFLGAAKAVSEVNRTTGDILDKDHGDARAAEVAIEEAGEIARRSSSTEDPSVRKLVTTVTDLDRVQQLEALRKLPDTLASQTDDLTLVNGYRANCESTLHRLGKDLRTVRDLEEKCLNIVEAADSRLRHRIKADFDLGTSDRLAMVQAVKDTTAASQEFRTIESIKLRELFKRCAPKQIATLYMPRYVEVRDALITLNILEESFRESALAPALSKVAESADMDAITGLLSFANSHNETGDKVRHFAEMAVRKWTQARLTEAQQECVASGSERPLVMVCGTLSTGAAEVLDAWKGMTAQELGSLMLGEVTDIFSGDGALVWGAPDKGTLDTIRLLGKIKKQSVVERLSISVCPGLDKSKTEAALDGLLDRLCDDYARQRGAEIAKVKEPEERARQLSQMSKSLDETLSGVEGLQPMGVLGKVYEAFLDAVRSNTGANVHQEMSQLVAAAESVLAPDEALAVAAMGIVQRRAPASAPPAAKRIRKGALTRGGVVPPRGAITPGARKKTRSTEELQLEEIARGRAMLERSLRRNERYMQLNRQKSPERITPQYDIPLTVPKSPKLSRSVSKARHSPIAEKEKRPFVPRKSLRQILRPENGKFGKQWHI
ncbi:hypothetical protein FOL47_003914 [Perkinsus chesapeaki]|uniref:Uncharacterized protein n=1 Tax=Perkinsus chesapeaki TaxID=330153 RepID=A0A7J6M5J4_PERCH|nr:hypothetical protein FOL47_003914 [Perkinsus chesapeaki]